MLGITLEAERAFKSAVKVSLIINQAIRPPAPLNPANAALSSSSAFKTPLTIGTAQQSSHRHPQPLSLP